MFQRVAVGFSFDGYMVPGDVIIGKPNDAVSCNITFLCSFYLFAHALGTQTLF